MEMLEAARHEYHEDQVQPAALEVLQLGNAYLQDVVDGFLKKMRGQANKMQIACFYELKASDVGRIVGGQSRTASVTESYRPARLTTCTEVCGQRELWLSRPVGCEE